MKMIFARWRALSTLLLPWLMHISLLSTLFGTKVQKNFDSTKLIPIKVLKNFSSRPIVHMVVLMVHGTNGT